MQVPKNITHFESLQPTVRLKRLQLCSAVSVNLPALSINKCLFNAPKIVLSPVKYSTQNYYQFRQSQRRQRVFPRIKK